MHPDIFKIGPLEIHSYGLMLALSFLLGIFLAMHRAKKQNIDQNNIMDLAVIIVISAILGSRFLYVIAHLSEFRGHWLDVINPFQGDGSVGIAGLTMLGGFLAALIFGMLYLWIKKLPVLKIADIVAPSVGLGIFITRIGCFLNGCCYGVPTDGPFGVIFPPNSAAGYHFPGVAIHPAQLYSSFYGLVILVTLLVIERWKKFDGFLIYSFMILYGISRFIVDTLRYYEDSMVLFAFGDSSISVNQGISILMILTGAGLIAYNLIKRGVQNHN
ncbi:MAG: prolipoprotein diacylglyceryl transferase [candidate division KSB1 bacterium]|jgi:phosphatidylglycerol:prolipoprotein diacylglycerol transferase|nr:prolipoprotein diacylglyceryl transferase [candidate division KSB1 bacterium]